ncbi:MAG: 50S ribosomal protein L15e [Candidatus Woesearchaeota archaeon]
MVLHKYLRTLWKNPKKNLGALWKEHLIEWRKEPTSMRIARPTRLDRARSLGYKAKPGIIMARQKVVRGGRRRPNDLRGRRTRHSGHRLVLSKSYQAVAEERANKNFQNLEVLGSYYLAKDGKNYWYEVIMIDPEHPAIKKDKRYNWIGKNRGRVFRGKTSAGLKSRGLRSKGKGAEKIRPSRTANLRRRKIL